MVGVPEKRTIVWQAQELFAEGCPRTRALGRKRCSRLDKGTKRRQMKVSVNVKSEVGWLRRRRSTVASGAKDPAKASELSQRGRLREEQRRCLAKQREKKRRREEETFQDGCLLDSEITEELRARVAARRGKDAANDRQRNAVMSKRGRWQC